MEIADDTKALLERIRKLENQLHSQNQTIEDLMEKVKIKEQSIHEEQEFRRQEVREHQIRLEAVLMTIRAMRGK